MDRTTLRALAVARFGLYALTLATSTAGSRPLPQDRLVVLAALLVLLAGVAVVPPHPWGSARLGLVRLAAELALTFGAALLGNPSLAWLLYLVVVAEAFLTFPIRSAYVVAAVAYGLLGLNAFLWVGPLRPAALTETMLSTLMGFVFAGAMSRMAVNQWRARRELEALAGQLQDANARLAAYAREVEALSAARERERLAQAVHDSVAHALTGILMGLQAARRLLGTSPDAAAARLRSLEEAARQGLEEVRRAVRAMRSHPGGGVEALRRLSAEFADRTGLAVAFHADRTPALPEPAASVLYAALQEALTNAARHGRATQVWVTVRAAGGSVELRVRDDGAGAAGLTPGMGLEGMRGRVEALGGTVEWRTAPGEGFELLLAVPVGEAYVG